MESPAGASEGGGVRSIPMPAGNIKMRGKLSMKLGCGCCVIQNFKKVLHEPLVMLLADDYTKCDTNQKPVRVAGHKTK